MAKDRLLQEMTDQEQLDLLIPRILEHSDYSTVLTGYGNRIKERLEALESKRGRLTPELALTIIKNKEQFDAIAVKYHPWPIWLENLSRGLITGRLKFHGGQHRNPPWAKEIDIVGIFNELTERFGFEKVPVYKAIAEHLKVDGWDAPDKNNSTTKGAEKVRKHIDTMRKALIENK